MSRRFIAATERALDELTHADLTELDLVAITIDGVPFAEHLCVVALGIGIDGTKHPLGVVEGSTENATVVKSLLCDLRDRGLDVSRPVLVVIDGAKALASAVREIFDHPAIQRCQLHKVRNVENHLPDKALSHRHAKMIKQQPDQQGAVTEGPRNSGHPRGSCSVAFAPKRRSTMHSPRNSASARSSRVCTGQYPLPTTRH